ncbi:MAG TPA: glycoside hydrolase family 3 N-terminal domain-containing protein, partial [Ktedonobacterales bacterium]
MTMTHGPDSSSRNPSAGPVRRSLAPAIAPRPARPARRILGVPLSPGMITGALCLFLASTVLPFLAGYLAPAHGGGLLPLPADPSVSIGPRSVDTATVTYRADQLAYVNTLISGMSLDEEIGQMLVTDFLGTDVGPELETKIKQYHIGSAILYGRNFYSTESMRTLSQHMQADSKLPMFIMLDQEGGTVNRLGALEGYRPSAEAMGAK